MTQQDILDIVRQCAKEVGIDGDLAVAIAIEESGCLWPKKSSRYEPTFKYIYEPKIYALENGITLSTEVREQMTSWGPIHCMGAVARELGFRGPLPLLFDPSLGSQYGCMKLKALSGVYDTEDAVIAAYNAGHARKIETGKYKNQDYVDNIIERLTRLRKV